MEEFFINRSEFQEPLFSMIKTEKVLVKKVGDVVQLIFINDTDDCPLLGLASDSSLTTDKFHAITREDKELEL